MRNPKRNEDRIATLIDVWTKLRPTKSFFGMTLEEFKAAMQPSLEARSAIDLAETNLSVAITQRDLADEAGMPLVFRVIDAIVADKDEGPNGEVYKELGYVRRSERASGLTRANRNGDTQQPPAMAKAA